MWLISRCPHLMTNFVKMWEALLQCIFLTKWDIRSKNILCNFPFSIRIPSKNTYFRMQTNILKWSLALKVWNTKSFSRSMNLDVSWSGSIFRLTNFPQRNEAKRKRNRMKKKNLSKSRVLSQINKRNLIMISINASLIT